MRESASKLMLPLARSMMMIRPVMLMVLLVTFVILTFSAAAVVAEGDAEECEAKCQRLLNSCDVSCPPDSNQCSQACFEEYETCVAQC